ncbi:MAG: bifunctional phosphopantothenoylcysteine decarboxylase/phosphopantothenate--cysteine ligase CoaBC [Chloroflexota bacterium]|nr:bifunctional phosphopantothenoylcysteine decarboxylase/phosphopantothenate--cysteine ligase CoaBC [Chloroflexota bacterium]
MTEVQHVRVVRGKRILLGVTGGIAAYKAVTVASRLSQAGAVVDVLMTEAAKRFVSPLTFSALTGRPVMSSLWSRTDGEIRHITMAKDADLFVIAPATANTIARLANGLADGPITVVALATRASILLAPAMETGMWHHPATQENMQRLATRGAHVVGPMPGRLASGAVGLGRMAEPPQIIEMARKVLGSSGPLAGVHVVITAGATQEALDPVRFLTNRSTGKMGVALASSARDFGATVTLIHAPMQVPVPFAVGSVPVRTAVEMREATFRALPDADVLIGAAAVGDYRPAWQAGQKIKKSGNLPIELLRNPDILAEVGDQRDKNGHPQILIGFAAETEDFLENARAKLRAKNLDLIVANDVSATHSGFGVDTNQVTLLDRWGDVFPWPLLSKTEVADRLMVWISRQIHGQGVGDLGD